MKVTDLKKHLKQLDQDEIIELVVKLAKLDKKNMAVIDLQFEPEGALTALYEDGKKKMHTAFFRSRRLSLRTAKAPLSDMKKAAPESFEYLDMQLYYVECGVDFTNEYGDIDGPFYSSICSAFGDFVKGLNSFGTEEMYENFKPRIEKIIEDTRHIGWGFHDGLVETAEEIKFAQK